jgi:hypothetical protein
MMRYSSDCTYLAAAAQYGVAFTNAGYLLSFAKAGAFINPNSLTQRFDRTGEHFLYHTCQDEQMVHAKFPECYGQTGIQQADRQKDRGR